MKGFAQREIERLLNLKIDEASGGQPLPLA
jgi:hypothetical protein